MGGASGCAYKTCCGWVKNSIRTWLKHQRAGDLSNGEMSADGLRYTLRESNVESLLLGL